MANSNNYDRIIKKDSLGKNNAQEYYDYYIKYMKNYDIPRTYEEIENEKDTQKKEHYDAFLLLQNAVKKGYPDAIWQLKEYYDKKYYPIQYYNETSEIAQYEKFAEVLNETLDCCGIKAWMNICTIAYDYQDEKAIYKCFSKVRDKLLKEYQKAWNKDRGNTVKDFDGICEKYQLYFGWNKIRIKSVVSKIKELYPEITFSNEINHDDIVKDIEKHKEDTIKFILLVIFFVTLGLFYAMDSHRISNLLIPKIPISENRKEISFTNYERVVYVSGTIQQEKKQYELYVKKSGKYNMETVTSNGEKINIIIKEKQGEVVYEGDGTLLGLSTYVSFQDDSDYILIVDSDLSDFDFSIKFSFFRS